MFKLNMAAMNIPYRDQSQSLVKLLKDVVSDDDIRIEGYGFALEHLDGHVRDQEKQEVGGIGR